MGTTFTKASTKEKGIILSFLKDQEIKGVHLTLKPGGKNHLIKVYPEIFKDCSESPFSFTGTLERISNDGMLQTKKLINIGTMHTFYETLKTEFRIPVELIDNIKIIKI